ncbi:MAG: DUF1800 domain-containing protein [Proteobacteria bacterium]|nr:DUF1800 domain-containing protein [Pseudomonadota bacterium]
MNPAPTAAAIAAHRFGLGEARLDAMAADPRGWLLAQIGPADPQRGQDLADAATGLRAIVRYRQLRQQQPPAQPQPQPQPQAQRPPAAGAMPAAAPAAEQPFAEHFRAIVQADLRARLLTAATTERPFAERLALFWANHFTVSMAKASARGLVGAFEREAIRPHIAGRFETLLAAAVKHPAMLRYLDNDQSAGPQSRVVLRLQRLQRLQAPRLSGLNENLAREVLELHTLGVSGGGAAYGGWGGYTQADVTEFARVLTGWRVPLRDFAGDAPPAAVSATVFDPAWHQPGAKSVLNRRYAEGPQALDELLRDLAQHPSTARFIATKLARHFIADEPPAAVVERLAQAYRRSGGDLPAVYAALLQSPEAWLPAPRKLKTPEEFVVGSARLLGLGEAAFRRAGDGGVTQLGQRLQAAPSPAGWPDRADEWLGPDALWKRIEWATRLAERLGPQVDARALAPQSLGPLLGEATRQQIERAADGPQAFALLLLSPEFQRR